MKTIGLLGGMSWESTAEYYRLMNERVKARCGGLHSAKVILSSLDFAELEVLQRTGQWTAAGELLVAHARAVERAGADVVLIGTNTMHKVAPQVQAGVKIPLLHLVDATAAGLKSGRCARPALLGTKFTMEEPFYRDRLQDHGFAASIPDLPDRDFVHRVIYEELCRGQLLPASRDQLRRIIHDLVTRGADGIILGCTELPLLVRPEDSAVPLYDTTALHAAAAVDWALAA